MGEYRRITRACAARDWGSGSHNEVLGRHRGSHLLQRFLTDRSLDHCYAGANVLDRARDRPKGAPSAGPHVLGNFHVKAPAARRAWLWRDTGELDPAWEGFTIDWMIAEGARREGDRTDLQSSHADILHDPDDTWLPTEGDYAELADGCVSGLLRHRLWVGSRECFHARNRACVGAGSRKSGLHLASFQRLELTGYAPADEHEKRWIDRARQAVRLAVDEAQERRGQLIAVDVDHVSASVAQDFAVSITIMEEYAERWVIIDRLGTDKRPVDLDTAWALADAAFDEIDEEDVTEILQKTTILDGAYVIDPGRVYAWSAIV